MNTVKVDLGKRVKEVNVYPVADAHIGSSHSEMKKFQEYIDVIAKDDNGIVFLNGDLINNAIRISVSDIYDEKYMPEEAIDIVVDILTPIKDKIVSVVSGNHEDRTYKQTGLSPTKNIAHRLGCIDKYHPIGNLVFVTFGTSRNSDKLRNTFSIYATHGSGGGAKVGSKANQVQQLAQVIIADVYIHSHTHTPIAFKEDYYLALHNTKGVQKRTSLFVNTNAFEGYGGYAQSKKMRPSTIEPLKIRLTVDERGTKNPKVEL